MRLQEGVVGGVGSGTSFEGTGETRAPLLRIYRGYRRRQISALLALLPPDAVRPLYRRARRWAMDRDAHDEKDPLATLFRFCGTVLPLPPFPVWLADFRDHRASYLEEIDGAPPGVAEGVSVTMDVRTLTEGGSRWYATLSIFRRDDSWRGYVAFRADGSDMSVRTADIFHAADPVEIRDRFRQFDEETLKAFLRSTLP